MDRKTESRLKKDLVIWLCTVGSDSHPHATLVWFCWDGEFLVLYSVPGRKTRDIERNPNVEFHLNSDPAGAEMVRAEGTAKIVRRTAPAQLDGAYLRKYRTHIKDLGTTPEEFAKSYHVEIHIKPVRFH